MAQEIIPKIDAQKADELLARVNGLLDFARNSQEQLESIYLDIGIGLKEVQDTQAWITGGFHSFDAYICESCEPRFNKKRNTLYAYKSAAEQLLPHFDRAQLSLMGVTKALSLKSLVKETGKKPSGLLTEAALNKEVKGNEFASMVAEARHMTPEKGKFRQLSFRADDDEWSEIQRAILSALATDPLPEDSSDLFRNKIALLRISAEFLSAYPCTENV